MNKGLDFKDELTKNDFRYISLLWVSVNQFFLVLLSIFLLKREWCVYNIFFGKGDCQQAST